MRHGSGRAVALVGRSVTQVIAVAALVSVFAGPARSQVPPHPESMPSVHDCSRWPASVYDEASGVCVCPAGLWWNLRGDACLPREHAAGEFCGTVWPGSQPLFGTGGGYRCVCVPPLLWDAQATGCRAPLVAGEEDCTREWPGTLPVLSPSGTEFECRCPGGRRWDDASRNCVAGAPVIGVTRGYFPPGGGMPGGEIAVPTTPGATMPAPPIPPSAIERGDGTPQPMPPSPDDDYPSDTPPPAAAAPSRPSNPTCDGLLAEIRARAAAGQADQADALGMKAAIAGCDPKEISEASRVRR